MTRYLCGLAILGHLLTTVASADDLAIPARTSRTSIVQTALPTLTLEVPWPWSVP